MQDKLTAEVGWLSPINEPTSVDNDPILLLEERSNCVCVQTCEEAWSLCDWGSINEEAIEVEEIKSFIVIFSGRSSAKEFQKNSYMKVHSYMKVQQYLNVYSKVKKLIHACYLIACPLVQLYIPQSSWPSVDLKRSQFPEWCLDLEAAGIRAHVTKTHN